MQVVGRQVQEQEQEVLAQGQEVQEQGQQVLVQEQLVQEQEEEDQERIHKQIT